MCEGVSFAGMPDSCNGLQLVAFAFTHSCMTCRYCEITAVCPKDKQVLGKSHLMHLLNL